jgi:hypothetical protein
MTTEREQELKQHHPRIILDALMRGQEWQHGDHIYRLSDDYDLCVVATNLDTHERVLLRADVSLAGFIRMAMEVSVDDAFIIGCQTALREMR